MDFLLEELVGTASRAAQKLSIERECLMGLGGRDKRGYRFERIECLKCGLEVAYSLDRETGDLWLRKHGPRNKRCPARRLSKRILLTKLRRIPILARFRRAPMSAVGKTRKPFYCMVCEATFAAGTPAYRSMLHGTMNGVGRQHRICVPCMLELGTDFSPDVMELDA
jgi:hypothetical protein